jgi:metallo-beta-lactamase family protein
MVYATIKQTDLLSGHADHEDIMNVVRQQDPSTLRKIFLVHGERKSMQHLADTLDESGYAVEIPEKGQVFDL